MGLEPRLEPRLDLVPRRAGELLVGDDAQARLEELLARLELRHRVAEPANRRRRSTARAMNPPPPRNARPWPRSRSPEPCWRRCAASSLPRRRPAGRARSGSRAGGRHAAPRRVTSPVAVISASHSGLLSQATHEHARAPVDEALGEPLMEGVGQAVLYPTGHAPANARAPSASRDGWRRRSRSGPARCGSRACRCRRPDGRASPTWLENHSAGTAPSFIRKR